jgi:hypothetical protein
MLPPLPLHGDLIAGADEENDLVPRTRHLLSRVGGTCACRPRIAPADATGVCRMASHSLLVRQGSQTTASCQGGA